MAIRFDCEFCGKVLKADESKAGKKVKCPSCEGLLTIPMTAASEDPPTFDAEDEPPPLPSAARRKVAKRPPADEFDDEPAGSEGTIACSVCGEQKSADDKFCPWCGEGDKPKGSKKKKRRREEYPIADLGKRFLGALVDGFAAMLFIGPGFAMLIAGSEEMDAGNRESPLAIIGLLLLVLGGGALLVIHIMLLANRSQSIGKYLMKTQILDYETDQPAGLIKTLLLRGFVNQIICQLPCVGAIYSLVDILCIFGEDHRCLHDQLAGTYVVDISDS